MNLERVRLGLMAAIAATCLVSIFAAHVLLSLAIVLHLVRLVTRRARLERLPLDGPILAFSVWTLLSASFSANPLASHDSAKKLVLFALLYLALDAFGNEQERERIMDGALLGGVVLAADSLFQYYFLGFDTLNNRPRSFLGHYMTASGLCMGVLVVAVARLLFARRIEAPSRLDWSRLALLAGVLVFLTGLQAADLFALEGERMFVAALSATAAAMALSRGPWPGPATGPFLAMVAIPVSAWALLISRTRGAWLGTLVGLGVIAVLRAPRLLWALPAGVAGILILRPAPVIDRLTLNDESSRDRIYMWQAGIDMIADKPVFGQGPGMIQAAYPRYRWPEAPNPTTPHLHDNALQIAAERGLPCLAWWLWLVAAAMGDAYRETRRATGLWNGAREQPPWGAAAALGLLSAVMVSGLFEYNFGDSEILMFTLLVAALPYSLRSERARACVS